MPRSRASTAILTFVTLGFLVSVGPSQGLAQPTIPEDFFATVSGEDPNGTYVEFGIGDIPPLPADFFGPGSDPFLGQVSLDGSLLDTPLLGDTSTLIQRDAHPLDPGASTGSNADVAIEIISLDLVSTQPITVTYNGGTSPEQWDVELLQSPTPVPPGELGALKTHLNGGIFDVHFYVQPMFIFTRVGDGESRQLDTGLQGFPPLVFLATGAPWVHAKDPSIDVLAPSDGWFVPCVDEVIPGDPASQETVSMIALELSGAARHTVLLARSFGPPPPPDPLATLSDEDPFDTWVWFGTGSVPPLPADFFGPGSDPFEGQIALEGAPFDPDNLADASTLVQRSANPFWPDTPPGAPREIDVEIVQLDLVSIEPVVVTYNGGIDPELWDVRVLLSPTPAPTGQLTATKTHANGGTYDMSFPVQPLFVFTREADGTEQFLDTGLLGMSPLEFEISGASWVHEANPVLGVLAPSDGLFVPGIEEYYPGYPESQELWPAPAVEISGAAQHTVIPARPPIPPDPHATISGLEPDGSFVRFGFGAIPPLPADYFGPGSDPFEGHVALEGSPFDPPLGDASTLVQRSRHVIAPSELPGASGTVDIEIVQLNLVSADPIVVTYNGGADPELWDVQVLLSPNAPPPGQLTATKFHDNGGTFDMLFSVQPLFVFTRVLDGSELYLDTSLIGMPPLDFHTFAAPWVHSMNPALGFLAPSDGWFVPGIHEILPGDFESQVGVRTVIFEASGAAQHTIFPANATVTAVGETPAAPLAVRSYPNPFNPSIQIEFSLAHGGPVEVGIYDLSGRLVNRLTSGVFEPGIHAARWNGVDLRGGRVASGVYLYRVVAPGGMVTEKMTLVK